MARKRGRPKGSKSKKKKETPYKEPTKRRAKGSKAKGQTPKRIGGKRGRKPAPKKDEIKEGQSNTGKTFNFKYAPELTDAVVDEIMKQAKSRKKGAGRPKATEVKSYTQIADPRHLAQQRRITSEVLGKPQYRSHDPISARGQFTRYGDLQKSIPPDPQAVGGATGITGGFGVAPIKPTVGQRVASQPAEVNPQVPPSNLPLLAAERRIAGPRGVKIAVEGKPMTAEAGTQYERQYVSKRRPRRVVPVLSLPQRTPTTPTAEAELLRRKRRGKGHRLGTEEEEKSQSRGQAIFRPVFETSAELEPPPPSLLQQGLQGGINLVGQGVRSLAEATAGRLGQAVYDKADALRRQRQIDETQQKREKALRGLEGRPVLKLPQPQPEPEPQSKQLGEAKDRKERDDIEDEMESIIASIQEKDKTGKGVEMIITPTEETDPEDFEDEWSSDDEAFEDAHDPLAEFRVTPKEHLIPPARRSRSGVDPERRPSRAVPHPISDDITKDREHSKRLVDEMIGVAVSKQEEEAKKKERERIQERAKEGGMKAVREVEKYQVGQGQVPLLSPPPRRKPQPEPEPSHSNIRYGPQFSTPTNEAQLLKDRERLTTIKQFFKTKYKIGKGKLNITTLGLDQVMSNVEPYLATAQEQMDAGELVNEMEQLSINIRRLEQLRRKRKTPKKKKR